MINNIFDIISKEDIVIIEQIALKNNLKTEELGRLLSKKYDKYITHQVKLNENENNIILEKCNRANISKSKFCRLCYKKALNEKLYERMNILEATQRSKEGLREIKMNISFDNAEEYKEMRMLASKLGISFGNLIRYFVINVEIDLTTKQLDNKTT